MQFVRFGFERSIHAGIQLGRDATQLARDQRGAHLAFLGETDRLVATINSDAV